MARSKAFTLIELLVVIAIIAILAAILFPVFAQAKSAAQKTVDISRFKQVGTAAAMYINDYDGHYMLSNSGSINGPGWGFGPPDTVPGQQLMPYCKSTEIFVCPLDPFKENQRIADHASMMGWNVNKLTDQQKMYALMVRTNMGYNYAFFSPWRLVRVTGGTYVGSAGTSDSDVTSPASTLMFVNAIWDRTKSGAPTGGGNWVVETPCWQDANGNYLRPMAQYDADNTLASYPEGWVAPTKTINSNSWLVYGGAWPFHNQTSLSNIQPGLVDGQVVTANADTSTKARPLKRLLDGCEAYGTAQRKGKVTDTGKFIWDLD